MTSKPQTNSLRAIFLRSQIIVSLTVLGLVTSILLTMLLALANYIDHRRIIELSKSIEIQVHIAKTSKHLQHTLTQIVQEKRAQSIVVYSKTNGKIIAASSHTTPDNKRPWIVAEAQVGKDVTSSLERGIFGIHIINVNGRRISILPLGPVVENIIDNNIIIKGEWPVPVWHKKTDLSVLSASVIWQHIRAIFNRGHDHGILLNPSQYSGAIVVETSRGWIAGLIVQSAIAIVVLLVISFVGVLTMQSYVLQKTVLRPVRGYLKVVTARRHGDTKARVPLSNVSEFDELAYQWNSLLEYRDVAYGQNMVLANLLEHVPVGIDVTDSESRIEYANPSFLEMTGHSLSEVIGEVPELLLSSSKMDKNILSNALETITDRKNWTGEISYKRKDGSDLICNTTFVPIYDEEDNFDRMITVRLDITKLKNDERDLIEAKTNAETADKAKSEFLSNMSHELRTPLNSIIGFSELMAAQKIGPLGNKDYVEFAKLIEQSSRTLLSSISLILDVSRLDAQSIQLNQSSFSVSELLHKLVESKVDMAHAMGVEIKRNLDCKYQVRADQRMLQQTLSYLMHNAIRYNIEGGQVLVSAIEIDDNTIITIKDTGIGISDENLQKVTDPFFRVDGSHARMKDGAGLGLTLVKKYTDEQKINFKIESELSHGTTITLTLPIDHAGKTTSDLPNTNNDSNDEKASPSRETA